MASNSEQEDEVNRTIWCGNVNGKVTEELLYELFLQAGPLEKVVIPKSGSCAFICYKHSVSVAYAIDLFKTTTLFGIQLNIKPRSGSLLANRPAGREQSYSSTDTGRVEQRQPASGTSGGHYGGHQGGLRGQGRYEPYNSDRSAAREDQYRDSSARRSYNDQMPGPGNSDRGRADVTGHHSDRGGIVQGGHHSQYKQSEGYSSRHDGQHRGGHDHQHQWPHDGSRGKQGWSDSEADRRDRPYSGPSDGQHDARGSADHGIRRPSAPPVAEASHWNSRNQGTNGSSQVGVPPDRPWESQGSGLLGPIPVGLLNRPLFVGDPSQQFISFSNPPQGFFGPTPDQISTELRRQRVISAQSQQLNMRRK